MGSNISRLIHKAPRFPYGIFKTPNKKLEHGDVAIYNINQENTELPSTRDEYKQDVQEWPVARGDFCVADNNVSRGGDDDEATPEDGRIHKESFKLLKDTSTAMSNFKIDLIEDSVNDNESVYITAESHEFETLISDLDKSDDYGDRQSTPQTWIGEDSSNPNDEKVSPKGKDVHRRSTARDTMLFCSLTPNHEVLPERTTPHGNNTDPETKNNVIDLDKVLAKPDVNISRALRRVDAALNHAPDFMNERDTPMYRCKTQAESINCIYLHVSSEDTIYRWEPESVITFNINCSSFPNSIYARRAAACLESAAEKWNVGNLGVRFERVADDTPAVFQLVYSAFHRRDPLRLADSFFPGDSWHQQHLCVYDLAFNKVKGNYDWLINIFCHELGHILGLRHEFAGTKELDEPSVQLGENNDSSIMNYFEDLSEMRIQESDYVEVRDFYRSRGEYDRFKVVDVIPRCFTPLSRPLQFQLQRSTLNLGHPLTSLADDKAGEDIVLSSCRSLVTYLGT
ncbi:hypothetical protein M434DRAFT_18017 [Hypoxylon sp. CO27-5]|nr:hypothetical protein M434DRAFT_18017 [Hypoxylon sp. CO27-5]